MAEVTLPVTGDNNVRAGTFVFRMQAAGVLRHMQDGQPVYAGVYDDLKANGLPDESSTMKASDIPGVLQKMFSGEGPGWLQTMTISGYSGVSHFSDASLRQVEGVYGAQMVAGSGELRLNGMMPERWRVSLPVIQAVFTAITITAGCTVNGSKPLHHQCVRYIKLAKNFSLITVDLPLALPTLRPEK